MKEIIGVGFLLFSKNENGDPCIFTVKELKDKPSIHKQAGMISFPLETFREEDLEFYFTIDRLLKEEVGINPWHVEIIGIERQPLQLIPGRDDIETVYGFGVLLNSYNGILKPKDDDIEFAEWMTLKELTKQYVRVETIPIIEHFKLNHFAGLLCELSALTA